MNPSLEDVITGAIPGMPKVVAHWPLLSYENGAEFMQAYYDAEAGKLDPFILLVEGSIPNEKINGEGHWAGVGVNPSNGQPITPNEWVDRLAPKSAAVFAFGTCATYGGVHAMRNNPTGAMGVCDYLGWGWTSAAGVPVINVPGCPVQPDNMTETLTIIVMALAGIAPLPELDEQHRLVSHFGRTVHEGCNRAGFYEHGDFSSAYGADHRCLVKLGCRGPVAKCNVPIRGWQSGIGGCPNVGGICIACTMAGFPDKYMPFMDEDAASARSSAVARFTYGRILRHFRNHSIKTMYDKEPEWRHPRRELTTGHVAAWLPGPVGASGAQLDVAVDARGSMPGTVEIGTRVQLEVLLSRKLDDSGTAGDAGDPDTSLVVKAIPRSGFEVRSPDTLSVAVATGDAPTRVAFEVEATRATTGAICVVIDEGPRRLGQLILRPELVERDEPPDHTSTSSQTSVTARSRSGETETIRLDIVEAKRFMDGDWFTVYEYTLTFLGGVVHRFVSDNVTSDRAAYVEGLYGAIEKIRGQRGNVAQLDLRLRVFGGELFDQLMPYKLRDLLWENRGRLRDIWILSTEPSIPWEMLHLKPAARELPDEVWFLAQMGVVRGLFGIDTPERLTVRASHCRYVIPYSGLPQTSREREFLERHLGASPITPSKPEVVELLNQRGGFDLLHYGGHAEVPDDDFSSPRLHLDGDGEDHGPLEARDVEQYGRFGSPEHHPLVVLNACQSGRAKQRLTSLGGFATAFLEHGAGAFVGTMSLVTDGPAVDFATALYKRLLAGDTFADAATGARDAARAQGDPTWLLYVVYARPHTTVHWSA